MSIWQWIYERQYYAEEKGDEATVEAIELFYKMLDTLRHNPVLGLQYGQQARQLAEMVSDDWLVQLLNHWELQARFNFLGDYTDTLELATRATVEVRLPQYRDFPQRVCLHEDLISAYVQQDPIGNQTLIEQALDYMAGEVNPSVECFKCLNVLRLSFVKTTGTPDETYQAAQTALNAIGESAFHLTDIYDILIETAYEQHDWDKFLQTAIEAESNARKANRNNKLASTLIWLALHAERTNNLERAKSLFQQAEHRANSYGAFIGKPYYTAMTAYHEMGGRLPQALDAQQTYLSHIIGKSKPFAECLARLEIIRLKKALDQPYDEDITQLKQALTPLKAQAYILDKLEAILA